MLQRTALLIANSILPAPHILAACRAQADLVICADGGANRAQERGLAPDFIVGDFDSMSEETRRAFPEAQLILRPSQSATDLEKALAFAVEEKIARAILVGITGLRFDHQLVNLNIVEKFCGQMHLEMHDDFGVGSFIVAASAPATATFAAFPGQQITLLAFRRVTGITTSGLQYPLNDEALEWAVRDGLSNEARGEEFSITVRAGNLFCYRVRRNF
ncbi:thiamine diphosphokinase [candidate division KSB1 bacterium]|nr:thiamine diphosphokinase [candidate division KSB1 bacterium]